MAFLMYDYTLSAAKAGGLLLSAFPCIFTLVFSTESKGMLKHPSPDCLNPSGAAKLLPQIGSWKEIESENGIIKAIIQFNWTESVIEDQW